MTFDLNEFFAEITLRALQSSHARCPIVRRNPMPRDISAELHDYGIAFWQFEESGSFGNAICGWTSCREVNFKGEEADEWV